MSEGYAQSPPREAFLATDTIYAIEVTSIRKPKSENIAARKTGTVRQEKPNTISVLRCKE